MKLSGAIALGLTLMGASPVSADIVGKTVPAPPLTAERVETTTSATRQAWRDYLERSRLAHQADVDAIAAERAGGTAPSRPVGGNGSKTMPLKRDAVWYGSAEARHIADVIVSFQTAAGGWGKNQPRDGSLRAKGQDYNTSESFLGTLDNDATITELRFLARVIGRAPQADAARYRQAFDKGLTYLLASQYPNGGWPQVWPLEGGYHDAITFNDGAMLAAIALLGEVGDGKPDFAFVSPERRALAKAAWGRGLACLLTAQIVINGEPAGWSQQHDPLTLAPVGARNYEPASLASAETAGILLYLMRLPSPHPAVRRAIEGGARWMASAAITGKAWTEVDAVAGRRLIDKPGAEPLWSRYYDDKTGKPIFGDRDLTLHDDVNEISLERRNGYSWFNTEGARVAAAYAAWKAKK